jgi:hypothetical protein
MRISAMLTSETGSIDQQRPNEAPRFLFDERLANTSYCSGRVDGNCDVH